MNIAKFLILTIFKNICTRLLFNFFNGSHLHGAKGLKARLYGGVRLQGPSHSSSFCFKVGISRPETSISTCIQKPKVNNTFDRLTKFLRWLFLVDLDGSRSF